MSEITDVERVQNETITLNGRNLKLDGIIEDIETAHDELDTYKSSALAINQALKEEIEATDDDDQVKIDALTDIQEMSFAVYLRLERGDLELLGERDGEYSGYMKEE